MRRSQFNVRTTYLSDEAYQYVEQLSKNKILSYKFALWVEKELRQTSQSTNKDLNQVLQEIENLKLMIQQMNSNVLPKTISYQNSNETEPIQQLSTDRVIGSLDEEDKSYDY